MSGRFGPAEYASTGLAVEASVEIEVGSSVVQYICLTDRVYYTQHRARAVKEDLMGGL
jgi:hypothetical protein